MTTAKVEHVYSTVLCCQLRDSRSSISQRVRSSAVHLHKLLRSPCLQSDFDRCTKKPECLLHLAALGALNVVGCVPFLWISHRSNKFLALEWVEPLSSEWPFGKLRKRLHLTRQQAL